MVKKFAKYALLFLVLAFIYTPILVLVIFSFTDSVIIGDWNGFSFKLYEKLINDSKIMKIVKDSPLKEEVCTLASKIKEKGVFISIEVNPNNLS